MSQPSSSSRSPTALLGKFNEAQAQLVVQTADLPLGTLADMVDRGAIDLAPGFQRRERWTPDKQSALIESFLLNVPVPPVYLAEEEQGTYTAIDGKQRLRAITDFIKNAFPLKNLERLKEAEGFHFKDLPPAISNSLTIRPSLRVVTLLKQTNASLKYEVFLRLNRGGEILNAQEIRNVAYRGSLNDAIYHLSGNAFLRARLKIHSDASSAYKNMSDAEYVLRFLTLRERFDTFSGDYAEEMNDFMRRHQHAEPAQVEDFNASYIQAIERCEQLWGVRAFKRFEGETWRDQFLAGMYDAQMLGCAQLDAQEYANAQLKQEEVEAKTKELFRDNDFETAVRTGTNTPARIKYRVGKVREMLAGL